MKKSWKTTSMGIIAIITAVLSAVSALIDGNAATNVDITATIAAITAGIGLIFARDNNVTSEEANAGK
jgi:hypothetical protein